MDDDPFYGARLKFKRAKHHIGDLEQVFWRYVKGNMDRMPGKGQRRRRKRAPVTIGQRLPENVPAIIGDAVHNLRVVLDYAYCVLVEMNGGAFSDFTRFPFGKDRQSLVGSINGQKKQGIAYPADAVMDYILDDIEPYEGGKLGLYELHRMDITDKHVVLVPLGRRMAIDRLDFVDDRGRPTGGGIRGISLVMSDKSKDCGIIKASAGSLKYHGDPKTAFDILFGYDQPFAGESVLQKLNTLANNVATALDALEAEAARAHSSPPAASAGS